MKKLFLILFFLTFLSTLFGQTCFIKPGYTIVLSGIENKFKPGLLTIPTLFYQGRLDITASSELWSLKSSSKSKKQNISCIGFTDSPFNNGVDFLNGIIIQEGKLSVLYNFDYLSDQKINHSSFKKDYKIPNWDNLKAKKNKFSIIWGKLEISLIINDSTYINDKFDMLPTIFNNPMYATIFSSFNDNLSINQICYSPLNQKSKKISIKLFHAGLIHYSNDIVWYELNNADRNLNINNVINIFPSIGKQFGLIFQIEGPKRSIPITVNWKSPEIINPSTGEKKTEWSYTMDCTPGIVNMVGYGFDYKWEMAKGIWEIDLIHNNKTLLKRKFNLNK